MAPSIVQAAVSLMIVGVAWASVDTRSAVVLDKRAVPGTWKYQGCYTDPGPRTLSGSSYVDNVKMTQDSCIAYCDNLGFYYSGTEYASECYCGNSIASTGTVAPASDCSKPCTGNSSQSCGNGNRLSLFWNGKTPPAGPSTNPGTLGYGFFGCYSEGTTGRALTQGVATTGNTVAVCIAACKNAGFSLAGLEYSSECWCGNAILNAATVAPEGVAGCNMLCAGNSNEYCGAGNRLDVYKLGYPIASSTASTSSPSSVLLSGTKAATTTTSASSLRFIPIVQYSSPVGVSASVKSFSSPVTISSTFKVPTSVQSPTSVRSSTSVKTSSTVDISISVKISSASSFQKLSTNTSLKVSSTSTIKPISSSSIKTTSSATPIVSSSKLSSSSSLRPSSSSTSSVKLSSSIKSTPGSSSTWPLTVSSYISSTSVILAITRSTSSILSSTTTRSSSLVTPSALLVSPSLSLSSILSSSTSNSLSLTSSSLVISPTLLVSSVVKSTSTTQGASTTVLLSSSSTLSMLSSWTLTSSSLVTSQAPLVSSTVQKLSSTGSASTTLNSSITSTLSTSGYSPLQSSSFVASPTVLLSSSYSSSVAQSISSTESASTILILSSISSVFDTSSVASFASSSGVSIVTSSAVASSSNTGLLADAVSSSTAPVATGYVPYGCYTEGTGVRALTPGAFAADTMTIESCQASCAGFTYFGVEYGRECYCGNSLAASAAMAPAADCNMACKGNANQVCGAGNRLNVYVKAGTASTSGTTNPITPTTTSPVSTQTGLPAGWKYAGCYSEGTTGRALNQQQPDSNTNTVEKCVATCSGLGYTIAGMEFATQCFCDKNLYNGAALVAESNCNMACSGAATENCGAGNFLSIYNTGALTVYKAPTAQKANLPGSWVYQGCYSDNVNDKRFLVWPVFLTNNNTATSCLTLCASFGYMAAGMEYGQECYCGDASNMAASGSTQQPETDCQISCSGDATYYCGGGSRLSYYTWQGPPLYTWDTPTGPAAGSYQFLIGGVIVPLITTAGINGKVVFMEKSGTGVPNATGTYELDLTLSSDMTKAWRPLHVKSDIFCSAGITLPDKAGRQLNIGGWAGPDTHGVRLYTPDGSPGVPGTNDWQENVNEISLLGGRWYPSAMVLTNGSVMVMGGQIGSNSAPTPSLEILPRPAGGYAKYLDWLDRTDPDNLYPFLFVLPTGNILVVYYNEARIIDEKTFDTIKTIPNLPGAVNNFLAGRTYPLEGTAVMLPLYPPYSKPATILVCGGSGNGGASALDNCVSTQPEAAAPTWLIERMPSKRVLSNICALPDGTYLILNGAHAGVGGFGLATDPNLQAVLYDPNKNPNQRMSIMATTIVARMYHSEAMLMQDGRVMVSGSDPEDGVNPQEYRVEVFNPPYALNGLPKPSYTITTANQDWTYGATYPISAQIPSGNLGGVRASMMAAVSSTHGNSMGQRTLFLTVTCTGAANAATCNLVAPPTTHVAPPGWYQIFILDGPTPGSSHWVRIGGSIADAAGLGNWPAKSASFTPPGLGPVTYAA